MLAEPAGMYAEVLAFLGLREWKLDDFPEHNKKPYSAIDSGTRERLEERFAEPNARLAKLLGRDFGCRFFNKCRGTRRSTRKTAWARDSSD